MSSYTKKFQDIGKEDAIPNPFNEASILLMPKSDKGTAKKNAISKKITLQCKCKSLQQKISMLNPGI